MASLPRFAILTFFTRRRAAHTRDPSSLPARAVKTLEQLRVRAGRPEADPLPRGRKGGARDCAGVQKAGRKEWSTARTGCWGRVLLASRPEFVLLARLAGN